MHIHWDQDPDEPELANGWAVPLDDRDDPGPVTLPFPTPQSEPAPESSSFLLQGSEPAPSDEFHPRLRRFGEEAA